MNEQEIMALLSRMSPSERAVVVAQLKRAQGERPPVQNNGIDPGSVLRVGNSLTSMFGNGSGGAMSQTATSGAPLSQAGMATTQPQLGPLADMGLSSSSPASGTMAQMGGMPVESMGAAPGYAYALPAIATALGTRWGLRTLQGKSKNWKDASLADNAGRAVAAMATFGGSELANKLFGGRKSTKEIQTGRWKDLVGQNITGAEAFYNQLGTEPASGPRYSKFQETGNKADLTAEDIWGSPDVIRAAGNDYFGSWDENKRRAFSQALLDKGLIDNRKGGIYATNDAAASELAKQFGGTAAPTGMQQVSQQTAQNLTQQKPAIDAGTLRRWRLGR